MADEEEPVIVAAPGAERLPRLTPDAQSPAQAVLYREIVEGPRGPFIRAADQSLRGPFGALLRTPEVGSLLQQLGLAVQAPEVLTARAREAVILLTAAWHGCAGEWDMHVRRARAVELPESAIADLAETRVPTRLPQAERTALRIAAQLLRDETVDDTLYADGVAEWGERGVVELVVLVSYFEMLCRLFGTFRLPH